MLSYENCAVVQASSFNFHKDKEDGGSDGEWRIDENGTVVYAKYFTHIGTVDKKDEKLFTFVEFVTASLYRRLLGEERVPRIIFIKSSASQMAIGSLCLPDFQTFNSFKKLDVLPSLSGDIGFEEYAATSIFLGNFDWYNSGNFGLKNGKIAAIDFAFTFTLKFSTIATFLSYLALKVTSYHNNTWDNHKVLLSLKRLEFNLHRFIAAIERILATPNAELLAQMPKDIETFKEGCTRRDQTSNAVRSALVWDVEGTHFIPLDPTINKLTNPSFEPHIAEPKDFTQFAENYLTEQRTFFEQVLKQLRIISRFAMPTDYFNFEWVWPYAKQVNNKLRVIEPLAYAAMRHIKIKQDNGETIDALDYAKLHGVSVFGSADPLHGFLSFCHAWGFSDAQFRFRGSLMMPMNDRAKNYLLLDKYERYALMCRTTLCTTVRCEPFAEIIKHKLIYINNTCHAAVNENKGNAEKQNQAYYDENRSLLKVGEWLKEYRNLYCIDVYLLLFISYSRFTLLNRNCQNEVGSYFGRVTRVISDGSNESNLIPSLFVDSRFLERLKQHCHNAEKETANYDRASRLLQFVGFKFTMNLIHTHLSECISLIPQVRSCVQLLSSIATFLFDKYEYPADMVRMRMEIDRLRTKTTIKFPENFQENIDKVFSSDKCTIPLIERF